MCQIHPLQLLLGTTSFLSITTLAVVACYQQPNNPFESIRDSIKRKPIMKAWHCHGRSQKDLVERLRQARIVKSLPVQQVMEQVDRQYYVGSADLDKVNPYLDAPLAIGKQQTISAPHMHAHVLEEMLPALKRSAANEHRSVKVLDVGCGSGYLTACLGRWFCKKQPNTYDKTTESADAAVDKGILPFDGKVFGMDIHRELVQFTKDNMARNDADLLDNGTVTLQHGNGWLGWPQEAPFDAIHVGAAAATFPTNLALQLSMHGVLLVPVGPVGNVQTLLKVERVAQSSTGTSFTWDDFQVTQLLGVRYVPLVQRPEH